MPPPLRCARICFSLALLAALVVSSTPAQAVSGGRGASLQLFARLEAPGGRTVEDAAVVGRYAYLAAGTAGLRMADVGDPVEPPQFVQYTDAVPMRAVTASAGHLYAVANSGDLLVYSLAVPRTPAKLRTLPLGLTGKLKVDGALGVATTETGLAVLDLSAPATPTVVGSLALKGIWELELDDGIAYAVRCCGVVVSNPQDDGAVTAISLADPAAPSVLDEYALERDRGETYAPVFEIGLGAGLIYVSGGFCVDICSGSLSVLDRSDPSDLRYLGKISLIDARPTGANSPPVTLVGEGGLVFVALGACRYGCHSAGVEVIDARTPMVPRSLRYAPYPQEIRQVTTDYPDTARQPTIAGSRLYVPLGSQGLVIFGIGRHQVFLPSIRKR